MAKSTFEFFQDHRGLDLEVIRSRHSLVRAAVENSLNILNATSHDYIKEQHEQAKALYPNRVGEHAVSAGSTNLADSDLDIFNDRPSGDLNYIDKLTDRANRVAVEADSVSIDANGASIISEQQSMDEDEGSNIVPINISQDGDLSFPLREAA